MGWSRWTASASKLRSRHFPSIAPKQSARSIRIPALQLLRIPTAGWAWEPALYGNRLMRSAGQSRFAYRFGRDTEIHRAAVTPALTVAIRARTDNTVSGPKRSNSTAAIDGDIA